MVSCFCYTEGPNVLPAAETDCGRISETGPSQSCFFLVFRTSSDDHRPAVFRMLRPTSYTEVTGETFHAMSKYLGITLMHHPYCIRMITGGPIFLAINMWATPRGSTILTTGRLIKLQSSKWKVIYFVLWVSV